MDVSQVRVSQIENGDIGRTEVGTLRSYVEALGGRLRIVAESGTRQSRSTTESAGRLLVRTTAFSQSRSVLAGLEAGLGQLLSSLPPVRP